MFCSGVVMTLVHAISHIPGEMYVGLVRSICIGNQRRQKNLLF